MKPRNDAVAWRQWLVPVAVGAAFIGIAILRPPCACGPRPTDPAAGLADTHTESVDNLMPPLLENGDRSATRQVGGRIAVLYLHGTTRCETCLEIERIAEDTVHHFFPEALAAEALSWQSIDYDLPENQHFDRTFEPPCPSLVLATVLAPGQFGPHRILGRTWDLIHEGPDAVEAYVREEVQGFMDGNRAAKHRTTGEE